MIKGGAEYVRTRYGVPAYRGRYVAFTGQVGVKRRYARIVGFRNGRLRVRFEGETDIKTLHPTWEVEYIPALPPVYGPWSRTHLPPEVAALSAQETGTFRLWCLTFTAAVLNAYDTYRLQETADWYNTHCAVTGEPFDNRRDPSDRRASGT